MLTTDGSTACNTTWKSTNSGAGALAFPYFSGCTATAGSDGDEVAGSTTDTWCTSTLTPTQVNSANFGVFIKDYNTTAHLLAADLVSISIDYTEATTTTTSSTSTSTTSTTLAGGPARRAAWIHGRPLPPAATFTPTGKDAQIANAGYVTYNFGAETASTIGTDATYVFRMLLAFDISSLTGKTVTGCRLTIQTGSSNPGTGTTGTIYRITRSDWVEGAGTGTPVAGATWNDYDGSTWTTPGSDYDGSTPTPVSFTPPVGAAVFYEFPDISAFCQDAITSRSGSLDLLIRQDTETLGAHAFNMRTKESATTSTKPKLVVTYQ